MGRAEADFGLWPNWHARIGTCDAALSDGGLCYPLEWKVREALRLACGRKVQMHNRKDEQTIRALIVEMTEGFNTHNSKAATRMYTSDADLVTIRGEALKGRVE